MMNIMKLEKKVLFLDLQSKCTKCNEGGLTMSKVTAEEMVRAALTVESYCIQNYNPDGCDCPLAIGKVLCSCGEEYQPIKWDLKEILKEREVGF